MDKIKEILKNPKLILLHSLQYRPLRLLSDKFFIKLEYLLKTGRSLNLKQPLRYNEKLQWLKLNDRNSKYTELVDKYEVRKFIERTIGKEYLIPLYGIYNKYSDINFSELPDQFVLKPTHTSGDVFICKDKNKINHKELKKMINKWMKREYFWLHREWPYKNVKPRIICEKYMVDNSGTGLKDYKFFCFNGNPELMFVASDRGVNTKFDFYDLEFNHIPVKQYYGNNDKKIDKPDKFGDMIELSRTLSYNIPHVRVDFYNINGEIYFGELTFYHFTGIENFEPDQFDYLLGEKLVLPKKTK